MKQYHSLRIRALAVLTALLMLFTPITEVYAKTIINIKEGDLEQSSGVGNSGKEGLAYAARTGFLVYMVGYTDAEKTKLEVVKDEDKSDNDGDGVGDDNTVILLRGSNDKYFNDSWKHREYLTTRIGNVKCTKDFGANKSLIGIPLNEDGTSRTDEVKKIIEADKNNRIWDPNRDNINKFISVYLGRDIYDKVSEDPLNYYLVLESVAWFKCEEDGKYRIFSSSGIGRYGKDKNITKLSGKSWMTNYRMQKACYLNKTYAQNYEDYKNNKTNVAIDSDGKKIPNGVTPAKYWNGMPHGISTETINKYSKSNLITTSEITSNKGYGMMAFYMKDHDNSINTYYPKSKDDDCGSPGKAEPATKENNKIGKYNITKYYYTEKITTTIKDGKPYTTKKEFIDKGQYNRENCTGKVNVNSTEFNVNGYKLQKYIVTNKYDKKINVMDNKKSIICKGDKSDKFILNKWEDKLSGKQLKNGKTTGQVDLEKIKSAKSINLIYKKTIEVDNIINTYIPNSECKTHCNHHGTPGKSEDSDSEKTQGNYNIVKLYYDRYDTRVGNSQRVEIKNKGRYVTKDCTQYIHINSNESAEGDYCLKQWYVTDQLNEDILAIKDLPIGSLRQVDNNYTEERIVNDFSLTLPGAVLGKGNNTRYIDLSKCVTGSTIYLVYGRNTIKKTDIKPDIKTGEFTIQQSQITKQIRFSKDADKGGSHEKILDYAEDCEMPAHHECLGHNYNCGHDCIEIYVNVECTGTNEDGTTYTYTDSVYDHSEPCDSHHVEYCSGWEWADNQFHHGLINTKAHNSNYAEVLAVSKDWQVVCRPTTLTQHKFPSDESPFIRTSPNSSIGWTESNWDYVTVIHRGKDKVTVAETKNKELGASSANTDLNNVSSPINVYPIDDVKKIERFDKPHYTTHFDVYLDKAFDNETTWNATIPAPETGELCSSTTTVELKNPLSINNIEVVVNCYRDEATGITCFNDESFNNSDMMEVRHGGYNTSSGRMVQKADNIEFHPYIQMRYDTLGSKDNKAYVLGNFSRSIRCNDYAEICWDKQDKFNLDINSLQWSIHARALDLIQNLGDKSLGSGAGCVLPGGATLSLSIKEENRQDIDLITYQCIVTGSGLRQLQREYKANNKDIPKEYLQESAIKAHKAYIESAVAGLESLNVVQYVDTEPTHKDAFSRGIEVEPDADITKLDNGGKKASTEDKYYFRNDNFKNNTKGSIAQEGDLDIYQGNTETHLYTFFTNTFGEIRYTIDNPEVNINNNERMGTLINVNQTLSGIPALINSRTNIVDKLRNCLSDKQGYDATGAATGTQWYSEALDGITVIVQKTNLTAGYHDPFTRNSILDPRLIPNLENKRSMFTDIFLSQYKMHDYCQKYEDKGKLVFGIFKDNTVRMKDMDKLFYTRRFWIPNATVQDLN